MEEVTICNPPPPDPVVVPPLPPLPPPDVEPPDSTPPTTTPGSSAGLGISAEVTAALDRAQLEPQRNLPEVTVSHDRPLPPFVVLPSGAVAPFLSLYPGGPVQSYVNTLDTPYVCRYSRANNPSVGNNMLAGFQGGTLVGMGVGAAAIIVINVVGFPEAEIIEGGALVTTGSGAWLFEAAVAEPGGSIAIGALSGGAYGGAVGFAGGLAVTTSGCQ